MADVFDDADWPVQGKILAVAGSRLTLDRTSVNYHEGMFLVVGQKYDPAATDLGDGVALLISAVDKNVVTLAEPAPEGLHGQAFYTLPRVTPADVSDFNAMDCMNLLQGLRAELMSEECIASHERGLEIMGVTDDDGTALVMVKAWESCQRSMTVIKEKCLEFGVIGNATALCKQNEKILGEILTIQSRLFEAEYTRRAYEAAAKGAAASDSYVSTLFSFQADDADDKKSCFTELVNHFLRMAGRANLRHKGTTVYEQLYTTVYQWKPLPDNKRCDHCTEYACFAGDVSEPRARCLKHRRSTDVDCRLFVEADSRSGASRMHEDESVAIRLKTRAWVPMMLHNAVVDVKTWINLQIDQHTQPELWNKFFTYYGASVSMCEKYISAANHPSFPSFHPNRNFFSFQNGMYDIMANKFYSYLTDVLPDNSCCVNHIDQYFDPEWTRQDLRELYVPGYDDILAGQEYDAEMCIWLDTFLGRLFFPLGTFDKWEKLPVIKGWAATGKSTIARATMGLMGNSNVGNIPANCEPQYALATVFDKFLWVCLEMCKTWAFSAVVMQSMISAEDVSVHAKHKTAVDVTWNIPGLAVGNDVPLSWVSGDAMGQLGRRVVPFPFDKAPPNQDPTVAKRFMANLGRFLARITRRYIHTAHKLAHKSLDGELPERLKNAKSDFMKSTNPLLHFIEDSEDVILAPEDVRILLKTTEVGVPRQRPSDVAGTAGTTISEMTAVYDLRMEWRIRLTELNTKFREWWIQNGLPKTAPSAQSKTVYDSVVKHLGVTVERDANDTKDRHEYMYGVKPATSMRAPQTVTVSYGHA
jgi:hypothetical protein